MSSLPDEIARLFAHLTRRARVDGEELALTATQRLALSEIAVNAPLRLHDLAARMAVSDATASRAVDVLVGAGLVERTPDAQDRRAVVIRPTPLGSERIRARRSQVERALRKLAPGERKQLTDLLGRLNDALE
jgi:DNA-binding MarR family transcriptional regulator